jgi:predicted transcriptional regulator
MQTCYRNRIKSFLNIANGSEVKQSEILSKANITHTTFEEYSSLMSEFGLIEFIGYKGT